MRLTGRSFQGSQGKLEWLLGNDLALKRQKRQSAFVFEAALGTGRAVEAAEAAGARAEAGEERDGDE